MTIEENTGISVRVGIDRSQGRIVIEFEKPLKWISLDINDALDLTGTIMDKVVLLNGEQREATGTGREQAPQVGAEEDRAPGVSNQG